MEHGETPSNSPGYKLCTTFLNIAKHGEITTQFQFTGTGAQPQRNRKLIQFGYVQYCLRMLRSSENVRWSRARKKPQGQVSGGDCWSREK